jgi:hypothetical protein
MADDGRADVGPCQIPLRLTYQDICYYTAPQKQSKNLASLDGSRSRTGGGPL